MKAWTVLLTRDVSMSVSVKVSAMTASDAEHSALNQQYDDLDWAVDDNPPQPAEVTATDRDPANDG